jgi:hypothetical protein
MDTRKIPQTITQNKIPQTIHITFIQLCIASLLTVEGKPSLQHQTKTKPLEMPQTEIKL